MPFENDVRSVARALWQLSPGDGGAERVDNDEIDCVCKTEDIVHLIECTADRTQKKVIEQANKLVRAKRALERRGETVKLWIVTKNEPTPDQRSTVRADGITILSLDQLRRRLLDGSTYLKLRSRYRFGSAADPATGASLLPDEEYVRLPMQDTSTGENYTVKSLASCLLEGEVVLLLGPFGAGKSLTVREIFRDLGKRYYEHDSSPVPVAINLRDHWGQGDVDEVLRRHANKAGFDKPSQLVRAWNAGRLIVLLDGFDELAAPAFQVGPDAIRRSRQEALQAVRAFVRDARGKPGLLIAGRDHYFDSTGEAKRLLSLPAETKFVQLGEFSDDQAHYYLKRKGLDTGLPAWLPRKPLLLGYLATRNLLSDILSIEAGRGLAFAWDQFVDRICEREALDIGEIDAQTIRAIMEALASRTRELPNDTGPLYENDFASAFKRVTGYDPLEAARVLLQRLPGLTARDQELGARSFVDEDMLQALRAGPVARFVQDPYRQIAFGEWRQPLDELGYSLGALLGERLGLTEGKYRLAAQEASTRWEQSTLSLDCLIIGSHTKGGEPFDCSGLTVREGYASTIDLADHPLANVTVDTCLIELLRIEGSASSAVRFRECMIGTLEGASSAAALPAWIERCEVAKFDDIQTNAAIMRQDLPLNIRVLLTIIRKLFLQRGSGRLESALHRGLSPEAVKYVRPILHRLAAERVIYSHPAGAELVWHGARSERSRVLAILASPTSRQDELLGAMEEIT